MKNEKMKETEEKPGKIYDVIVVGAGPAGLSAGIFAGRRNLKVLIVGEMVGGQMWMAHELENYPGIERTSGQELAKTMEIQARKFGCEIKMAKVVALDLKGKIKTVKTDEGDFTGKAVVLSTGSEHRALGIKGEKDFLGHGVSYCASCDAPLFKSKKVAVVGGSDTAISYALLIKEFTDDVFLIHRGDSMRAEVANQKKLQEKNIRVIWNTMVEEIKGTKETEKLVVKDVKSGKISEIPVDGVFVSVGNVPTATLAKNAGVSLDAQNYISTDKEQKTNLPGVFAAGDVCGGILQIAQAVGQGAIAGVSTYKYIQNIP